MLRHPAYHAARVEGALAQLGERHNGIVEVSGSIPLGSTILLYKYYPLYKAFVLNLEDYQVAKRKVWQACAKDYISPAEKAWHSYEA